MDDSAREALALEMSDKDFLHIDDDDASLFSPQQPHQKRSRVDFSVSTASPTSMLNNSSHNRRKTPHHVNRFL